MGTHLFAAFGSGYRSIQVASRMRPGRSLVPLVSCYGLGLHLIRSTAATEAFSSRPACGPDAASFHSSAATGWGILEPMRNVVRRGVKVLLMGKA